MKKYIGLAVLIIMVVMTFFSEASSVLAENRSGKCGENVYYESIDVDFSVIRVRIFGTGEMYNYPETILTGGNPFQKMYGTITRIDMEFGPTYVGKYAFYKVGGNQYEIGGGQLEEILLPNSVKIIGNGAFKSCGAKNIVIPNSVDLIGDDAFLSCTNLRSIYIPDSVTRIGERCFFRCYNVTSLRISTKMTTIPEMAFNELYELKEVYIPGNIKTIGDSAFADDVKLETVTIARGVQTIGYGAFCRCRSLKQVTIPEGVTTIESRAFKETALTEITVPNSVTQIGNDAAFPDGIVLCVYKNSYAHKYAVSKGIKYRILKNNPPKPGDLNDDGQVNLKDSMLLLQHLAGWEVTFNQTNADINGDGAVNLKDSMLLLQYLAGWESAFIS